MCVDVISQWDVTPTKIKDDKSADREEAINSGCFQSEGNEFHAHLSE